MTRTPPPDTWERGNPYERYIGRWSRRIAPAFLAWLDQPAGLRWLDVGCGTGALSAAILESCRPAEVHGVEPSEGFLNLARQDLGGRAGFSLGSATALPVDDRSCDIVVSALVLNFLPDLEAALSEMTRVAVHGAVIAGYVWDYADGMQIIRQFWDAAASLDPAAAQLHEAMRFPLCNPAALQTTFASAGLILVDTAPLELTAEFTDFDDYWLPFLGGQGPAPAYAMSLPEERRAALRARLQSTLPIARDGTISLGARAWAVRGQTRGV
jgi:SAM-dependent methyltransferase